VAHGASPIPRRGPVSVTSVAFPLLLIGPVLVAALMRL
jgi:hypothetical protein